MKASTTGSWRRSQAHYAASSANPWRGARRNESGENFESKDPMPSDNPIRGKYGCTAKKRDGSPCGQRAMKGSAVCKMHGGKAPQVLAAARLRLALLVDPAIGVLQKAMKQQAKQPGVALAAARDVLDRAGLKEADKLEVSGQGGGPVTIVIRPVDSPKE